MLLKLFDIRISSLFFTGFLVIVALVERLAFDLGPNIELITVASLLATYYLSPRYGMLVALVTLAISDYFLGLTTISLFTWSAFAAITLGATLIRRIPRQSNAMKKQYLHTPVVAGIYSMGGALLFYVWTNFGVWLVSGMYPPTFTGLLQSYYMALPFLKWHLVSNMLIVPVGFTLAQTALMLGSKFNFKIDKVTRLLPTDATIVQALRNR